MKCECCGQIQNVRVTLRKQREISGPFRICLSCLDACIRNTQAKLKTEREALKELEGGLEEMLTAQKANV